MDERLVMRENAAGLLIAPVADLSCGRGAAVIPPSAAGLQHCGPWTGENPARLDRPSHGVCDVPVVATARNSERFPRMFVHTLGPTCAIKSREGLRLWER
jgi:hypothetical protein